MIALWAILLFLAGGLVGHCIRHLRCCEKRIALLEETRKVLDETRQHSNSTLETLEKAKRHLADADAICEKLKANGEKRLCEIKELHRSEMDRAAKA